MKVARRLVAAGGVGLAILVGVAISVDAARVGGPQRFRPYNVVVVVLDTSMSFQQPSREPGVVGKVLFAEALGAVQRYLGEASTRRERRREGEDLYFIVAADAASQLIWSGSRQALTGLTPEVLRDKLAVRKQFALCTDVGAALNAAAAIVSEHARASERVVLIFSDLITEPPVGSYSRCAKPTGAPPADIRWDLLSEASLGFYFVSKEFAYGRPDQQWMDELSRRGIAARFLDSAQTLTAGIDITPPPPARRRTTEKERAEGEALGGLLPALARLAITGFAGLLAIAVGVILLTWLRGRRRRPARVA
jgi:hypothetical protein